MPNSPDEVAAKHERWEKIKEIFHAAAEAPPNEQDAIIETACGDDVSLKIEVRRLLKHRTWTELSIEQPAWTVAPRHAAFKEGETVADRFRVIRHLGSGGMGDVYLAYDKEIAAEVALKTISTEAARNPIMMARLRQEIQLSRRVTHPNVCRVFDLERAGPEPDDIAFVTMEFIPGETLAAYLERRGKLPLVDALPLIQQICSGLSAAHRAGVLHRDLKPGNIMLEIASERVVRAVITDFGLAKPAAAADNAPLTRTGEIAGTLAYLAPEVLSGEPASVASDLYALGVVLLEMCTGEKRRDTKVAISSLEPNWRMAIAGCLDLDPARRPLDADTVSRALEAKRHGWARWAVRAVIAAVIVAAILGGYAAWNRYNNSGFPPGTAMMFTPLVNFTGESQLDGLTDVLRQQVGQSARLRLWDSNRISQVLLRMRRNPGSPLDTRTWREIAVREDVGLVVFSTLTRLGDEYVLGVQVQETGANPGQPEREWDHSEQAGTKASLFDAVRRTGLWVRTLAGESRRELRARDQAPQEVTTASWDALDLFHRAEASKAAGDSDKAVLLLQQAVAMDPGFAMAHARLGDILMSLRRETEALAHWAVAMDQTHHERLTRAEDLRIRTLYAIDTGDLAAAEGSAVLWFDEFPQDYLPSFYLGWVYRMQGRLAESKRSLEEARRRHGDEYYILASEAHTFLVDGAYDNLQNVCARLRAIGRADAADQFEGSLQFLTGKTDESLHTYQRMTQVPDEGARSRAFLLLARIQAELGQCSSAIATLKRGIDMDQDTDQQAARSVKLLALSYLERNEKTTARALALEATRIYSSPDNCMQAGTLLARLGFPADASEELTHLSGLRGPRFEMMRQRLEGEIDLARRNTPRALAQFKRAAAIAPPIEPADYLARAFIASHDLEQARIVYSEILKRPGVLWRNAESAYPGMQRDVRGELETISSSR